MDTPESPVAELLLVFVGLILARMPASCNNTKAPSNTDGLRAFGKVPPLLGYALCDPYVFRRQLCDDVLEELVSLEYCCGGHRGHKFDEAGRGFEVL